MIRTRRTVAHMAAAVGTFSLIAACGGSSDGGDAVGPDVTSDSETAVTVGDSTSPTEPEASAEGSCEADPSADFLAQMEADLLSRYEEGAGIDASIVSSQCLGASECVVHTTKPGVLSLTRILQYPDGDFVLERELGDTPELTGDVLDRCFTAAGLEPTPDDIALAQASLWSTFLSIEPGELPPEGVAELSADVRADFPIDFDNYSGPVLDDVDGVPTVFFVAEDLIANYYVVQTALEPQVESTVSVVYVG